MQVHLKALGCRLNEAELETWARDFRDRGFTVTTDPAHADLVVINTCAVTDEAVRKSRKLLRRTCRDNPRAKLVITGCYSSVNKNESSTLPGVDLVVENARKDELPRVVIEALDLHASPDAVTVRGENLLFARGRQRAFIKVQDGCRYRCTYCIVTVARGEERSRAVTDVTAEINRLSEQGVREVVLTGVHLGGYGSDRETDITGLVSGVLNGTEVPRIRLGSLEPWDIPRNFWDLFGNPRLMPHLHLPIQSGADTVLRRMSRRCRTAEFRQLVETARSQVPDLNITTDVIVGFTGETEREFGQTLDFVDEIGFGHVHIFGFSPRGGTKAALLPDAVPDHVRRERSRRLHELADGVRARILGRQPGKRAAVLVENVKTVDRQLQATGYTPNFLRTVIVAPAGTLKENDIVEVELSAPRGDCMSALPVPGQPPPPCT